MRTVQDTADDLSFHVYYFCKIECEVTLPSERSNAEIVCHKLIVMTRVAGDMQSSSRRNSGDRRLVLEPLPFYVVLSDISLYVVS